MTWQTLTAILGGIVLIGNAFEKIVKGIKVLKAPEDEQTSRISLLEDKVTEIERKLATDDDRIKKGDAASRVSQVALIALLEHGINGNNLHQMEEAKKALQEFLVNHE